MDVYAEERRLGKMRRVAVECESYNRALTQEQITAIYSNYRPLWDGNLIDEVLVVTTRGLAPSAYAFVAKARGLAHLTLPELQNAVIDFSVYLNGMIAQFDEDGLSTYCIKPKLSDGTSLEAKARTWVRVGGKPIAILASYGMGKTSFARFMAAALARDAQASPEARIPIFVTMNPRGEHRAAPLHATFRQPSREIPCIQDCRTNAPGE